MSLKKTLLKNTSYNVASYIVLLLASFFSVPIILSNLGKEGYGVLVLITSIAPLMSVLDLGLSSAVVRFMSLPDTNYKERIKIWQTSFFLFTIFASFVSVISLIGFFTFIKLWPALSSIDNFSFVYIAIIISITLFINHINIHFMTLPQANQRFDIYNTRTILVGISNTLGSALLSYIYPNLIAILLFQLFFHLLALISLFFYVYGEFKLDFLPKFHLKTAKILLNFGLKNFLGKVANQSESQFSKYSLGSLLSASSVAVFGIPQKLVIYAAGGFSQLTLAFFPMSASLLKKERIGKLLKLIILLQGSALITGTLGVVAIYWVGFDFLLWWLKDPQLVISAFPVFKILSWFFFLTILTPIPSSVLDSINSPQTPSFFAILTAVITITLIFLLTPDYGVLGPAYAAVASSSITVPSFLIVFVVKFSKFYQKTTSS
jgi:O-antigen/teichoic acid export membrane protein